MSDQTTTEFLNGSHCLMSDSLCVFQLAGYFGVCVLSYKHAVITSMWENLQCKREASTAMSFFLCRFCAKYQPVFCRLLLCSSANVLLFVSYFDGWLQLVLRQTGLPGRRKRGLHSSYFFTRSFFFGSFCSFRWRKKGVMTEKWLMLSRACKDSNGKSETWDCQSQVLSSRNEDTEKLWFE